MSKGLIAIGSRTLLNRACGRHGNGRSVINKALEKILYVKKNELRDYMLSHNGPNMLGRQLIQRD